MTLLTLVVLAVAAMPPAPPLALPAPPTLPPAPAAAPKAEPPKKGVGMTVLLKDGRLLEGAFELLPSGDYRTPARVIPAAEVVCASDSRATVQKALAALADRPAVAIKPPPGLEAYNALAVRAFVTDVQPILSNCCASCHARPAYEGAFKLAGVDPAYAGHSLAGAAGLNLLAAVGAVDRSAPSSSDLLVKLRTVHGGQRAPAARAATEPAYLKLELWAHWLASPEGTPRLTAVPKPKAVVVETVAPAAVKPKAAPVVAPTAGDPFDPAPVNARRGGG